MSGPLDGAWDLVEHGQHRAGLGRMPLRDSRGQEQARGRCRRDPGLATTLRRAMALACEDRSASERVGLDQLAVAEFLPLGELGRLLTDRWMIVPRRIERLDQTLARGLAPRWRLRQELWGLLTQHGHGLAQCQERLFRVAHHCHEDVPVPAALTPKAPPDFGALLVQAVGLARHLGGPMAASLGDPCHRYAGFFCALDHVVASVTRWLPCSHPGR